MQDVASPDLGGKAIDHKTWSASVDIFETGFAFLGRSYISFNNFFASVGKQETAFARAVAIGVGYFDGIAILMIIAALGEHALGWFGKAVADAITNHGVVVKVSSRAQSE